MKRLASNLAVAAALACGTFGAVAAPIIFGTLASGTGGPASVAFAELSATPNGADLDWVLSAPGLDLFGPGFAITSLVINVPPDSTSGPCCSNVTGGPAVDLLPGGGADFPGTASAHFDFTGNGILLTDNGSVSWTWTGPFSIASIDFVLHVQGLSAAGAPVSLWYVPGVSTPPVPEPHTYAIMLAGLGLLGFMARRRT